MPRYYIECSHAFSLDVRPMTREGEVVWFPTRAEAQAEKGKLDEAKGMFSHLGYRVREEEK